MKRRNSRKNNFLESLAILVDEYKASFEYTTDDDGIHIKLEDGIVNIFAGHMDEYASTSEALRSAQNYD